MGKKKKHHGTPKANSQKKRVKRTMDKKRNFEDPTPDIPRPVDRITKVEEPDQAGSMTHTELMSMLHQYKEE